MGREIEIIGKYNWEYDGFSGNRLHFSNHNSGLASFEHVTIDEACKQFPRIKMPILFIDSLAERILKQGITIFRIE